MLNRCLLRNGVCISLLSLWALTAMANPSETMVKALDASVLRIEVNFQNGDHGYGSGVVISEHEVVTSCHVVRDGVDIQLNAGAEVLHATAIKPDWRHDVCILEVPKLRAPAIHIGHAETLHYEQPIFTIGYPRGVSAPVSTFGVVKGLFAMDNSVIIRATSAFEPGASGGGAFDEQGELVGIITVRNKSADQFYYVPVEWVLALKQSTPQPLGTVGEKPFWASAEQNRPYFMKVVPLLVAGQWDALRDVANRWVNEEPNSVESWFYLGLAEFKHHHYDSAKFYFEKAVSMSSDHQASLHYLSRLKTLMQDDVLAIRQ